MIFMFLFRPKKSPVKVAVIDVGDGKDYVRFSVPL